MKPSNFSSHNSGHETTAFDPTICLVRESITICPRYPNERAYELSWIAYGKVDIYRHNNPVVQWYGCPCN